MPAFSFVTLFAHALFFLKKIVRGCNLISSKRCALYGFLFWTHRTACGILVPQPGVEPRLLAVKPQSPNHWPAREFPRDVFLASLLYRSFCPSHFILCFLLLFYFSFSRFLSSFLAHWYCSFFLFLGVDGASALGWGHFDSSVSPMGHGEVNKHLKPFQRFCEIMTFCF